jgi:hypothetical protein
MAVNRDFRDLFSSFVDADVRFLVVGAHAVIHYTAPRYTKDLDLWIDPAPDNARRAYRALAAFGAPLHGVSEEDLCTPGVVLQIGIEPNRVDVLTEVEALQFAEAWEHRARTTYGEVPISLLGLNDLIVNKRAVGRLQDQIDLEKLEQAEALRRRRTED